MPSLVKTLRRWYWTVRTLMNNRGQSPGPFGECLHPHRLQHPEGDTELSPGIDPSPLPTQPLPVHQVGPRKVCPHTTVAEMLDCLAIETLGGVPVTQ